MQGTPKDVAAFGSSIVVLSSHKSTSLCLSFAKAGSCLRIGFCPRERREPRVLSWSLGLQICTDSLIPFLEMAPVACASLAFGPCTPSR